MAKHTGAAVLLIVILLSFLAAGWQPAAASPAVLTPFKIMPFGDSITSSVGSNTTIFGKLVPAQASYRYWLDQDLHAAGIPFEFTGTRILNYSSDGTNGVPLHAGQFDQHNEGWSGTQTSDFFVSSQPYFIDTILNAKRYGTTESNIPDMVLIHLGTNDLKYGRSVSAITLDLGRLIDKFRAKNPKVIILMAQIIPCTATNYYSPPLTGPYCANIPGLNAALPALAQQKNTALSPVVVVDLYTGFDSAEGHDTYDGLHPQQSGEIKMADRWLAAISQWYLPYHMLLPVAVK